MVKGAQASSSYVPQLVKFGNNVKFRFNGRRRGKERERGGERERGREMPQRQPDKRQAVVHMDGLLPVETTAAAAAQPSIDTATHFRGSNKATTATATTATEAATSSTTKVKFFVLLVA